MNEYNLQYDPDTFQMSLTRPVFVRLEDRVLRIWNTKAKVPRKAMWNDPDLRDVELTREREFSLEGCEIKLLPEDLDEKKLWSRKYPICIVLKLYGYPRSSYDEPLTDVSEYSDSSFSSGSERAGSVKLESTEEISNQEAEELILDKLVAEGMVDEVVDQAVGDDSTYLMVDPVIEVREASENNLLLFARTRREKEEWFRRLVDSSRQEQREVELHDYIEFMKECFSSGMRETFTAPSSDATSAHSQIRLVPLPYQPYRAINALANRMVYHVMRSHKWKARIYDKLQKKLDTMTLPSYIEKPVMLELDLGTTFPELKQAGAPRMDVQGLWIDMEIAYKGAMRVGVTTKLLLTRQTPRSSADEAPIPPETPTTNRFSLAETMLNFIRRRQMARALFFQAIADNRYFQAAAAALSQTRLLLTVELQEFHGVLVLNVPPPPSDRLWVSFRDVPAITMVAVPFLGDRALSQSVVCRWVEQQLRAALEKVLVMPNMEDILLPFLTEETR